MRKIKFGVREIVTVVLTTGIYVLIGVLQFYFETAGNNACINEIIECVKTMELTLVATIFGPLVTGIGIVGARILENVVLYGDVDFVGVFLWLTYGLIISEFSDRFGVREGKFKNMTIMDYIVVVVFVNIGGFLLANPIIRFYIDGIDIITLINSGLRLVILNVVTSGLIGSIILAITSAVIALRLKKKSEKSF